MYEVVIVGAGPAGLTLGAELSAQGIRCLILEKRRERLQQSRAFSLTPHTLELLETRGIAQTLVKQGVKCELAPLGDGKKKLTFKGLKTQFPYLLSIAQYKTEKILEEWALQCGVEIKYGAELINLAQDEQKVKITYVHEMQLHHLQTNYLIGSDGAHSKVCELANIFVTNIKYKESLMHADVMLNNPPIGDVFAKTSRRGMVAIFPVEKNIYRVLALDQARMHVPIDNAVSFREFNTSVITLANRDFNISSAIWINRFRCQQRHAAKYRSKRIFLAGDAAHTQLPAGGQGLQISIQDGFNLGWKLAAVIKKQRPDTLLDTYESERRPLIDKAMRRSIIMYRYEIAQDKFSRTLKWLTNKLLNVKYLQNYIVNELAGLTTKYHAEKNNLSSFKRITGKKIINLSITTSNNSQDYLFKKMIDGKFILLGQEYCQKLDNYINLNWRNNITYITAPDLKNEYGITICLLRPDSFIAWGAKFVQLKHLHKVIKYYV